VNLGSGFRQIKGKTNRSVYFEAFGSLNGETVFAQIEQLAQIKHHAGTLAIETGIHRRVQLVANPSPTFADGAKWRWILQLENAQFHGSDHGQKRIPS